MCFFRKNRIKKKDFSYLKQQLTVEALAYNIEMFNEIADKKRVLGEQVDINVRKKLNNTIIDSLNNIDFQMKRYQALSGLLDVLHKRQIERRDKLLEWVDKFCEKLNAKDEKVFINKFCNDIDFELMKNLFISNPKKIYTAPLIKEIISQNNTSMSEVFKTDSINIEEVKMTEVKSEIDNKRDTVNIDEKVNINAIEERKEEVVLVQENPDFEPKDVIKNDEILNLINQ